MNRKNSLMMLSIIASMFLFAAHNTLTHGGGGGGHSHSGGGHYHGGGGYGAGVGVGVGVGLGVGLADGGYYDGDYYDEYDDGDYYDDGPIVEEDVIEEGGYRGRHDGRGYRR